MLLLLFGGCFGDVWSNGGVAILHLNVGYFLGHVRLVARPSWTPFFLGARKVLETLAYGWCSVVLGALLPTSVPKAFE